jgi:hypothetical protein
MLCISLTLLSHSSFIIMDPVFFWGLIGGSWNLRGNNIRPSTQTVARRDYFLIEISLYQFILSCVRFVEENSFCVIRIMNQKYL